ncbi:MAG: O-acetyl-ADP-ribose deacetylase [Planctomycetaceae bacterium]|nr:O-acetyl-ADP-ribose deacetylase [Planctomycetaceae bacterium]
MQVRIGDSVIELVLGDITEEKTDAIVNAANSQLAGGGGVDGAIHRAAGPTVIQQTNELYPQGCPTGEAVITEAGRLKAKYIIHTVGPVWRGGKHHEEADLRSAYRNCLELAARHGCQSIAFPAISTGVYSYPLDLATEIAISEIRQFLTDSSAPILIRCVLFNEGIYGAYSRVLEQ